MTQSDGTAPPPYDLRDVLAAIFRHWVTALIILLAALVSASVYLAMTPTEYTAQAKLVIRLGREKSGGPLSQGSGQSFMFSERSQNVNNEVEILRDISVVRGEFAALKAATPIPTFGPPPVEWGPWLVYQSRRALSLVKSAKDWIVETARAPFEAVGLLRKLTPDEKLLEAYLAAFKTVFVKETDVIITAFTWSEPNFAAEALNRLIDAYKRRHVEVYADEAPISVYTDKLERARAELAGIDAEMTQYLKGANTASFQIEQQNDLDALSDLSRQRSTTQIEREGIATRLERLRKLGPGIWQATPPDADATVIALDQRWATLRTKRAELATRFKPAAPEFATLDKDLAELTRQKYRFLVSADTTKLAQLDERVAAIASSEKSRRAAAIGQSDASLKYGRLAQRKQLLSDEIGLSQRRIDELRVGSGLDSQSVTSSSLVSRALPPTLPSGPNRGLILGLAAGLGLVAAIAYIALAEALAQTYRSASEVARSLRVPVLAALPLGAKPKRRKARREATAAAPAPAGGVAA